MKHIKLFEQFVNEAKKDRITIDASLWNGKTPEIIKNSHGDQFVFFSGEVHGGKYLNILDKPNNVLIVIEKFNHDDKFYIKVGYGSENDRGEKRYRASIGDAIIVSLEELKSNASEIAKKIAANFVASKKYFDMNFAPYDTDAIFKIEKDVEKPALELIEFTVKNLK